MPAYVVAVVVILPIFLLQHPCTWHFNKVIKEVPAQRSLES